MDITNGLTLSGAVKDKSSPLRQYLQRDFPNTKPLQAEYKAIPGPLLVDSQGAPAGTVGTAMDLVVRFLLNPKDVPESSRARFPLNNMFREGVDGLIRIAARESEGRDPLQDRAVWGLALCVEAYRAGGRFLSVVDELVRMERFDVHSMLAQASPEALAELAALRTTAKRHLIPQLEAPFHLGPEFESSKRGDTRRIAAEADMICNGLLLDIKTQLGARNTAGNRTDTVGPDQLYQLLAYALLDHSDTYAIDRLGIYSARYGVLVTWTLEHFTSTLADAPVDISEARQKLHDMLQA